MTEGGNCNHSAVIGLTKPNAQYIWNLFLHFLWGSLISCFTCQNSDLTSDCEYFCLSLFVISHVDAFMIHHIILDIMIHYSCLNIHTTQLQSNNARFIMQTLSRILDLLMQQPIGQLEEGYAPTLCTYYTKWYYVQLNSESASKGWERRKTRLKHQHAQRLNCHHLDKYNRYTVY